MRPKAPGGPRTRLHFVCDKRHLSVEAQLPKRSEKVRTRVPVAAFHVLQGVYLSMHPQNVDALPSRPGQRLRFFTGFSGWAPNQLQRELQLDAWFVMPVTEEILFRADTRGMWKELFDKARGSRAEGPVKTDILFS